MIHRMMTALLAAVVVAGCSRTPDAYEVRGVVVDVTNETQVVVDHEEIPGLMKPMVMPFQVSSPELLQGVRPGDEIVARLVMKERRSVLDALEVTGHQEGRNAGATGPAPLRSGQVLPATQVKVTGGETWTLGEGQGRPTVLTFLYTTCPIPEFCPTVVIRLQQLQEALPDNARIVAVTIDQEGDTLEVLQAFAEQTGAQPDRWRYGRVEGEAYTELLGRAALATMPENGEVIHGLRLLVLDGDGRLIERYDDNFWPQDRVVQQLATGEPKAPPGADGTLSVPSSIH